MPCDLVVLIFNNAKCIELRGCVLYGYKNDQEVAKDGVRPVQKADGQRFEVRSPGMTHWRWVAAADYSDRPENNDVVLIDTGKRPLTKCDWKITCNPRNEPLRRDAVRSLNAEDYKIV
jgi:hypothetical protein